MINSVRNRMRAKSLSLSFSLCFVRVEGLEPPCREAPDPKSGMSTNFTIPADVWFPIALGTAKIRSFLSLILQEIKKSDSLYQSERPVIKEEIPVFPQLLLRFLHGNVVPKRYTATVY
jgi:hypothetical protein